jgi:S-methylmethionine-dependent homocysteine/selenocysteine methylase
MDITSCLQNNRTILLEGALGERLKHEYGLSPDKDVAWAYLVYTESGRNALRSLWGGYIATAQKYGLPFAATTPTRRVNQARVTNSHYNQDIIQDNVRFLKDIQASSGIELYIGGLMGCKGDAYKGTDVLSACDAFAFHSWQAGLFAEAGIDFLYAAIMPALPEAIGMAQALAQTRLPYLISFMIRDNGRLIDGTAIHDAIERIDGETEHKPLCYMTNCVHPTVLFKALSAEFNQTALVRERFCGIQANASPLPPEELDVSVDIVTSDGVELANGIMELKEFIKLKIVGGCCGTDHTHMEQIARFISQ